MHVVERRHAPAVIDSDSEDLEDNEDVVPDHTQRSAASSKLRTAAFEDGLNDSGEEQGDGNSKVDDSEDEAESRDEGVDFELEVRSQFNPLSNKVN